VSVSPSVDGSDDRQRTDLTTDACATLLSTISHTSFAPSSPARGPSSRGGRLARLAAICERVFSGGGMIFPDRQHRQIYDPRKRTDKMLYSLRMPDDLVIFVRCNNATEKRAFASVAAGPIAAGLETNTLTHLHRATTSSLP
jgi:hypothetical protein